MFDMEDEISVIGIELPDIKAKLLDIKTELPDIEIKIPDSYAETFDIPTLELNFDLLSLQGVNEGFTQRNSGVDTLRILE